MASLLLLAESSFRASPLADSIRQLGYEVIVTQPVDDHSQLSFDVILLQLNPTSLDTILQLRTAHPTRPIIAITDDGPEDLTLAALQAGAVSFLHQSNLLRDLGNVISEVLHTSTSQLKRAMFLKRLTRQSYEFTLENDTEFIGSVVAQAELLFDQFKLFDDSVRMQLGVAIHEALVNAMIHGNLEVSSALKNDNWSKYHRQISQRNQTEPYIHRRVRVLLDAERGKYFRVVIRDDGPGFDVSKLTDATDATGCEKCSGRGMMMIRAFFDEVVHNARGNEISMTKHVENDTL
jgi:DNA-binding response OmpR family regulator